MGIGLKLKFLHQLKTGPLGSNRRTLQIENIVEKRIQRPAGGNLGVQLAQGPGCDIAGIGEERLPGPFPFPVEGFKILFFKINLAAHPHINAPIR